MRPADITPLLLLLLLVPGAAAVGFGSFPVETQRTVPGLEASFAVGLVNTGNVTREVTLTADAPDGVAVTFARETVLLPPSTTDVPRGDGWTHLGDGRYARTTTVEFTATIARDARETEFRIPVTATAVPAVDDRSGIAPRAALAQDHVFTLTSTSPLLEPEQDQYGFQGLWNTITGGSGENAEDAADSGSTTVPSADGTGPAPENNLTTQPAGSPGDGGTGPVTIALVAGIVLSLAVIAREIL